jgi:hypothetical protein
MISGPAGKRKSIIRIHINERRFSPGKDLLMADTLTITQSQAGPVTVLHLAGVLNAQSENDLLEAAQSAHASDPHALVIDMTGLQMIMSAGLRALQNIYKVYTPHTEPEEWEAAHPGEVYKSPRLKFAGAAPQVHYVLSLSGFLHNIPSYPSFEEAVDSFQGSAGA